MTKTSLKQALHKTIKLYNGNICPYSVIETLCKSFGIESRDKPYKISNAERRLRLSESPEIETIYNEHGFISGYKWRKPIHREENKQLIFT